MKKTLALLLTLVICLSMFPMAQADDRVLESYDYNAAIQFIGEMGWEGISASIKQANAVFWLPNTMTQGEVSEEYQAMGVVKGYVSRNLIVQIQMADYQDDTLEDYLAAAEKEGCLNPRIEQVNGVDWLIYDTEMEDAAICRVAASKLADGQFLEVVYFAMDEELDSVIEASIATLRFREK